jgi:hypothetical protein
MFVVNPFILFFFARTKISKENKNQPVQGQILLSELKNCSPRVGLPDWCKKGCQKNVYEGHLLLTFYPNS